jgi:hypothetical protein
MSEGGQVDARSLSAKLTLIYDESRERHARLDGRLSFGETKARKSEPVHNKRKAEQLDESFEKKRK